MEGRTLKYSKAITTDGTEIDLGGLTVLVGPNNSGKSTTLHDIYTYITADNSRLLVLLQKLELASSLSEESLLAESQQYTSDRLLYNSIAPDLRSRHEFSGNPETLKYWINQEISGQQPLYRRQFGYFQVARLDAETRLELAKSTASHDASSETPRNLLQMLYQNKPVQQELDNAFFSTFRQHLKFDYTGLAKLYLRVGQDFENIPESAEEANAILSQVPPLDSQGDGMRSFTAVVLSILLTEDRILLLDEPDAFLHPEQARRLGRWIAERASAEQQIFIATHNSHFLQGLISAAGTKPMKIVRLDRRDTTTRFNRIPSDTVRKFGTDPLLSSQRVTEAIFHSVAVICEADSDRTIYQAVAAQELNNTDVLFVNAQNKQTCGKVVAALREAQILARSVVDIDMLRDSGEFKQLLDAHNVPLNLQNDFQEVRKEIADKIEETADSESVADIPAKLRSLADQIVSAALSKRKIQSAVEDLLRISKWADVKDKGVEALDQETREKAETLIDALFNYNIALVPVGELESWIPLTETKSRWIEPALTRIYARDTPERLVAFVRKLLEPIDPVGD